MEENVLVTIERGDKNSEGYMKVSTCDSPSYAIARAISASGFPRVCQLLSETIELCGEWGDLEPVGIERMEKAIKSLVAAAHEVTDAWLEYDDNRRKQ